MNILHISAAADTGGAGRAMLRLHQSLLRQGHDSQILARLRRTPNPRVHTIAETVGRAPPTSGSLVDLARMQVDEWFSLPTVYASTSRILDTELFHQAQVIHLHNLHGYYFNYLLLPAIAVRRPTVWTLHDMWPITGHCAYSYSCNRWKTGCGNCPLLRGTGRKLVEPRPSLLDRSARVWNLKQNLYRQSRLYVVSPSRWLARCASDSILSEALTIQHIPYCLDLDMYRPLDGGSARKALGLPQQAKVVLFVAAKASQPRKGLRYLVDALNLIEDSQSIVLLSIGTGGTLQEPLRCLRQVHLGQVTDEELLNAAYNAADVYVSPTLADNLPLAIMEALSAGTPVVAFDVGGVSDMVRHMETGFLARYQDTQDLVRGINTLLGDDDLRLGMRERCREVAVEMFAMHLRAASHLQLYEKALEEHNAR